MAPWGPATVGASHHHIPMTRPIVTAVGRFLTPKHGEPQVIYRITVKRQMIPVIVGTKRTRVTIKPAAA